MTDAPRRVVCVTGMHRSGTSLTSRVMNLLGVDLGRPKRLMQPGPANPRGFWEAMPIRRLGDAILAALGGSWKEPPPLDDGWELSSRLDPFRDAAREILDRDFPSHGPVGWKDPRTSLLLPFWRTVVPVAATLLVTRDPRAVAASLARRNGLDPEHSARLWLTYTNAAWSADPAAMIVRHRDFFSRRDALADDMADFLGLPRPTAAVRREIGGFVDAELRHDEHLGDGGPVMERARARFHEIESASVA